jgi:NAD(P)-dependent dehydrogenase (short-subunit alcohol dehydrogenase family)
MMDRKVLVIGATGVFGSRMARRLARIPGIKLVLASRHLASAQNLAREIGAEAIALDRSLNLAATLLRVRPWLVIDASGPFQGADYRVPLTALDAGAHFVDLADARDYVLGFAAALDAKAKAAGLAAIAGASSAPALSAAAVERVAQGWKRIDSIDIAITPDGVNEIGVAAIAGVTSYAGAPVRVFRHGAISSVYGWCGSRRWNIPRLGRRRVAPVDTPDADLLSARHHVRSRIQFRAGLESRLEQWGLIALARLRRIGVLPSLKPLAPFFAKSRGLTRQFASDRGGMLVAVQGLNANGTWTRAEWSLLAENGDGPFVPGLPAAAATQMLLAGELPVGAGPAIIPLANIEAEFEGLGISAFIQNHLLETGAFERTLGTEAYAQLPAPIRDFHSPMGEPIWIGEASIESGSSLPARAISWIYGLPQASSAIPVKVSVEREADGSETWTRNFGGEEFHSVMKPGPSGRLTEWFGPFGFDLALTASEDGLSLPVIRWRLFGLPMPRALLPISEANETLDSQGRFRFDVRLSLPFFGLLTHYRGWLKPARSPKG